MMTDLGGDAYHDQSEDTPQNPNPASCGPQAQIPLQSRLDQSPSTQMAGPIMPNAFDMNSMTATLPQTRQSLFDLQTQYGPEISNVLSPSTIYPMHHAAQYLPSQGAQFAQAGWRAQQQHFFDSQYYAGQSQSPQAQRQQHMFRYGMNPSHYSHMDARFGSQMALAMGAQMQNDISQSQRRASEPAVVPSFPRGPPRKPKQSGHALWVGNLPPAATVTDLKDHFSRDATNDIESLFLISKSNCAFVNYRTEAACAAAMNRFHDSRFQGVRLVCRLRRGASNSPSLFQTPHEQSQPMPERSTVEVTGGVPSIPVIVGGQQLPITAQESDESYSAAAPDVGKVPEKFFIVKSLTVQDLEASVRNGTWATQSHNESSLNDAYNKADNVYLVFSANKSGEYFGYARMASRISGEPVNLGSAGPGDASTLAGTPQSIPTPATETAPRGHIIDDSARGTIFWEAEQSENEGGESPGKEQSESAMDQQWGRQFKIEWISTAKLPFYRTRGLRNPWNANREVKIARDGTELEPGIGRRLVQMFHRPPPPHETMSGPQIGMPYR